MALHSWVWCARTVCYRAGKATRRAVPFALPTGCGGCVGVVESWLPVCATLGELQAPRCRAPWGVAGQIRSLPKLEGRAGAGPSSEAASNFSLLSSRPGEKSLGQLLESLNFWKPSTKEGTVCTPKSTLDFPEQTQNGAGTGRGRASAAAASASSR